jgi:hypothetical protein
MPFGIFDPFVLMCSCPSLRMQCPLLARSNYEKGLPEDATSGSPHKHKNQG